MTLIYHISDLLPYINWIYYYHVWQVKQVEEQHRLRREAEAFLASIVDRYHTHALFMLADAYSDGDDIVVLPGDDNVVVRGNDNDTKAASGNNAPISIGDENKKHWNSGRGQSVRIPCLRQQQVSADHLCLADFIAPKDYSPTTPGVSALSTKIGLFATSADSGLEKDLDYDPYQKMMAQLLADRLAEATAECLHEEVRKHFWGYAADEHLSIDDMLQNRFLGIRPAVGYPSLPDSSVNFILNDLLDMQQIGITLTESGAMRPHASVSGLMMAHPQARYFTVGHIGSDQLSDYARRRHMPLATMRKFLAGNI